MVSSANFRQGKWRLLRGALVVITGMSGTPAMAEMLSAPSAAAPARDGDIAIQEELDLARKLGTAQAYDLFIARHPNHRLAETARRERARLSGGKPNDARP